MSKYDKALEALLRSRDELLQELVRAGENGGSGLATRHAPVLVNVQNAIDIVNNLNQLSFPEKMAEAKAAKKSAQ